MDRVVSIQQQKYKKIVIKYSTSELLRFRKCF